VRISGAVGSRAYGVNGIFEPTAESYNDLPCYKKKGEEIWIELVQGASGYRWYIKPTANRGASSVCYAYCKFEEESPTFPHEREKEKWMIYDGNKFDVQDACVTTLVPEDTPLPDDLQDMMLKCKEIMKIRLAKIAEELERPSAPGSFCIEGATGSRALRTNGIFEPMDEEYNGMPVYKKKGDDDTFMELVSGASGLRWYIKPLKERGASSVCFAYHNVVSTNVNLPQNCTESLWNVYDGNAFAAQSTVVCKLVHEGAPLPQRLLDMVEAKKVVTPPAPTPQVVVPPTTENAPPPSSLDKTSGDY